MTDLREPGANSSAATSDGSYPRPQLVRDRWLDLSGEWGFRYDDGDIGVDERWFETGIRYPQTITVPYPPESSASGIGDTGFHPVVWYSRVVTAAELRSLRDDGGRLALHFGAVDYRADVWVNGQHLGHHEGGHTPFEFDLAHEEGDVTVVVRAEDDPLDVGQPRGKQDWRLEPHGIWYHRTTGIWQPVWLEARPRLHIRAVNWTSDLAAGTVGLELHLNRRPIEATRVAVRLSFEGEVVAEVAYRQTEPRARFVIDLPHQANGQGYEGLLWSPENPRLIDAVVSVTGSDGRADEVSSYLGLRRVSWADGHFMLNDRPCYIRAVLAQGYWLTTHLAAPDADALRQEVELAKAMGFNTVRLHQKIEDPRFLYWADRLGLMVWGENASAFEFSTTAVSRMVAEWTEAVHRDRSHPSIVAWVPLNESWGVQHISHDPAQLDYARSLYHLTKALDPSRPVISNDGWEHADSDLWTVHDYSPTGAELAANYANRDQVRTLMEGVGPLGRRMRLLDSADRGQPVIVSEFGGVSYAPSSPGLTWGYVTVTEAVEFERALREQFEALQSSPVLAGFCYTQLTDTAQEANGLSGDDRRPKLPIEVIRSIVHGDELDSGVHPRPIQPVERINSAPPETDHVAVAGRDGETG